MGQGVFHQLEHMSQEDRRTFDRWLKANAVAGFLFSAALVVMALVGSGPARTDQAAVAASTMPPEALVASAAAADPRADGSTPALYPGRYSANPFNHAHRVSNGIDYFRHVSANRISGDPARSHGGIC